MALDDQMNMFQEENNDMGLMQEGGDIDPVSGNEVPPGGTQEGVRDDVEANVSKGEMVIPEDVVRYFGVDHFMKLRDEAKMGYKKMDAMGQMGNPDEASIPDDAMFNPGGMPFSVIDMEYVDDEEEQGEPQFPVGGLVDPNSVNPSTQGVVPNTSFLQPAQTQTVNTLDPITGQPTTSVQPTVTPANIGQITTPTTFTASTLAGVNPTATATNLPVAGTTPAGVLPQLPSFGTATAGTTSINFFRNSEGQVIQIPVLNGRQTFDEPEGFQRFDPDKPSATPFDTAAGEGAAGAGGVRQQTILEKSEEQARQEELFGGLSGDEVGPDTGPADSVGAGGLIDAIDAALGISSDTTSAASNAAANVGIGEANAAAAAAAESSSADASAAAAAANATAETSAANAAADTGNPNAQASAEADATAAASANADAASAEAAAADAAATAATGTAADAAADADGPGADGGRVICTELYAQGLLDKNLYLLDVLHTDAYISPITVRGYHFWAIPLVKKMRNNKAITNFLYPLALLRAKEIAYIMDKKNYPKGSFLGRLIRLLGESVCYLIGIFVATGDYSNLYKKEES